MSSLKERIELLEDDLRAHPPRISAYSDLPFAILRYAPDEEWELRRQIVLLATRLGTAGKDAHIISLAALLWEAIDATEGLDAVVRVERDRGFERAQDVVTTYLSDPDWSPLPGMVAQQLRGLDPERHVAFLTRAAALSPAIYHMSQAARRDAGPHRRDHDPLLSGRAQRRDQPAVYESEGTGGARQLPGEDLWIA